MACFFIDSHMSFSSQIQAITKSAINDLNQIAGVTHELIVLTRTKKTIIPLLNIYLGFKTYGICFQMLLLNIYFNIHETYMVDWLLCSFCQFVFKIVSSIYFSDLKWCRSNQSPSNNSGLLTTGQDKITGCPRGIINTTLLVV